VIPVIVIHHHHGEAKGCLVVSYEPGVLFAAELISCLWYEENGIVKRNDWNIKPSWSFVAKSLTAQVISFALGES